MVRQQLVVVDGAQFIEFIDRAQFVQFIELLVPVNVQQFVEPEVLVVQLE